MAIDPVRLYDYLTLARRRLFDWVRPLSAEQYTQVFPFGLKTLRATLLEMAAGEWVYLKRLVGETPPPREQRPIREDLLPTFADLERAWTEIEPRSRATLAGVTRWDETVEWVSPIQREPGKKTIVTATRADVISQMVLHEVHHRAQAMAMLRQLGVPAQNLDYSILMFRQREEPA